MVKTRDGVELMAIVLFYGLFTVAFPAFLLYGAGAATESGNLVKFFLYGILPLFVVLAHIVRVYLQNRNFFEENPEYQGFNFITIHSPSQTWLGKRVPELQRPLAMISVSLLFAGVFGIMVNLSGQFVSGIPTFVSGSIANDATSLGLAVEPAVSSETLFFNIGLLPIQTAALLYFFLTRGAHPFWSVVAAKAISVLVTTAEFFVYHFVRYPNDQVSQIGVLLLGFVTNVVTAITNSGIPAYLIHGTGNFFHQATRVVDGASILTSQEALVVGATISLMGAIGTWLFFLRPMVNRLDGGA